MLREEVCAGGREGRKIMAGENSGRKSRRTIINPEIDPDSIEPYGRQEYDRQNYDRTDGMETAGASTIQVEVREGIRKEIHEEIHEEILAGEMILGKYQVVRQLEELSGEADLYLSICEGEEFAAKVYKRRSAPSQEVVDRLRTIDSPYVAKPVEAGSHRGFPAVILPYFENGSLAGKIYTEDELRKTIIPCINEGLKAIHDAGILHRDLKPSNIMMGGDGETVSIIDFGISSAAEGRGEILMAKTGMSPEYSAPETFRDLYCEDSDYYSFGITLFELYCGYTPFAGMRPEEIEESITAREIPFPEEMSASLQDLICALTYYDITNRNNKNDPDRRWTYEEVKMWLDGENLRIPGEDRPDAGRGNMPLFEFLGEIITDPAALVPALAENWEEGKKQVFRGQLTAYLRTWNRELAGKCQAAEEEAARENGKDDIIYWRLLHQIDPGRKGFFWKGQTFESIAAFGRDVLEHLWNGDESQFPYYATVLSEKVLSAFVNMAAPGNEKLKRAAEAIETSYEMEGINGIDRKRTYYLMGYTLSGQKLLLLNGEQFRTVGELANYMKSVLDESLERFETLCHRLVDYDGTLDFQLETWLIALGKQKELDKWRASMN